VSQTKNNFIRTPTPLFQSGSTSGGIHTEERKGRKKLFLFNRTTFKKNESGQDFHYVPYLPGHKKHKRQKVKAK
jgi:hypothetical protein